MRSVLLLAVALALQAPATVTLSVRVFDGTEEVTRETRIALFRAGDRQAPLSEVRAAGPLVAPVPPGFYDVQAIREQSGRVVSIRWAERLVVMAYPDEAGRHLEVINLQSGFGALDVRGTEGKPLDAAIFAAGNREHETARPIDADGDALFVVPAGRYDVRLRRDGTTTWHPDIEVPVDRTRFWVAP